MDFHPVRPYPWGRNGLDGGEAVFGGVPRPRDLVKSGNQLTADSSEFAMAA